MRRGYPQFLPFVMVLVLLGIGMVMVYSTSAMLANDRYQDTAYFLKRQAVWTLVGIAALAAGMVVDLEKSRNWVKPLLVGTFLLLLLVLVPGVGKRVGGARRWIGFHALTFQPSEVAKIALIFFTADWLSRDPERVRSFARGFVPPLLIMGAVVALLLKQPDLGTGVVLCVTVMLLLFVAGAKLWHFFLPGGAFLGAFYLLVVRVPYRMARITAFMDPWSDPLRKGFQMIQSMIALGSGGLTGVGLGESKQKLFYLPEPHTDFIFAVLGEELGLIGTAAVVALFLIFVLEGIRIASRAENLFTCLLASGLTSILGLQAFINMAVVTGLLPTKGITLPFVSFGGSSLVFSLFAVGILLNISRHRAAAAAQG